MTMHVESVNPFPGLRPFQQDEDYLFFGREDQTMQLLQRLGNQRFVAVVGSSGSGKSSLVRCGLLSELQGGKLLRAGASWEIAVTHPGGNPLALLVEAILEADLYDAEREDAREQLLATLSRSHFGLVEAVKQAHLPEGTNFLLVVDQFEEVFRFKDAGQTQQEVANEFISMLLEAVSQSEVPIYVVLTMRSDFIGDCGQFESLAEVVSRGEFLIPRLTREQYKRVIEGPIKVAGGQIAPRLLQRLLNDLGEQADQLPCLQHALMRTWSVWSERNESDSLDLPDYERVGKMSEALSLHADEVYESLANDSQRQLCAGLFKALTVQESENRGIRRPQRLGRLCQILDVPTPDLLPVINAYRQHGVTFLMPAPEFELQDNTIIDISHESLMRVWTRLRHWVEEEAQSVRIYARLSESAALYAQGKAGLYREPELGIALGWYQQSQPNAAWAERYRAGFGEAVAFLEASQQAHVEEEQAREAARQRELEQAKKLAEAERSRAEVQQRSARRLRGMVGGLAVVAAIAVGASVVALQARRDAQQNAEEAVAQKKLADDNADEAQQQARRAERQTRRAETQAKRAETQARLADEARRHARRNLYYANINMAQRAIETSGGMGRVQELLDPWRPIDGETDLRDWEWYYLDSLDQGAVHVLRSNFRYTISTKYSPDGTRLASGGAGGITVWDAQTGRKLMSFRENAYTWVVAVDWSPNGKRLASSESNAVKIWDVSTGRSVRTIRGHNDSIRSVAWHPDGKKLASSSEDGTAMIFDIQSGERLKTLGGHSGAAYVDWSPDGNRLATCDEGGWGRIWEAESGEQLHLRKLSDDEVYQVVWSPDGKQLAFSGADATIKICDADLDHVSSALSGHANGVWGVAWNSLGSQLVSGSFDQTVKLWDVVSETEIKTFRGHGGLVFGVCFSPDDQHVASAGFDHSTRIWDIAVDPGTLTLKGHTDRVRGASWSPDASQLASVSADGSLRIWDDSGQQARTVTASQHELGIEAVCWSPDGTRIATAGYDRAVTVWDAATGSRLLSMQLPGGPAGSRDGEQLLSVAWSPDGRYLASAGQAITIWDAHTGDQVRQWTGHTAEVRCVAWSPDGARLASGSRDDTVRVWDWKTGEETARFAGQQGRIFCVAWSPNGEFLAGGGRTARDSALGAVAFGFVRLWSTKTAKVVHTLRGHEQRVWSISFSHDGTRIASASEDGKAKVWDIQTGQEMLTLNDHQGLRAVAWSPDGMRLATAGLSKSIKVWDATPGYRRERSALMLTRLNDRVKQGIATPDDMQLRGQILARQGRWDEAAADFESAAELLGPEAPSWFETDTWVVGPYPDDLSAAYPPEHRTDPLQTVPGVAQDGESQADEFRWRVSKSSFEAGLDFGEFFDHAEHVSGYALARVYTPVEYDTGILLSFDDAMRLWLNGKLAFESQGERNESSEGGSVPVVLRKGWNVLLAKVVNRTDSHGLNLRFADDPLALVRVYEDSGRWEEALELWDGLVEKDPDNAELRLARARVYVRLGQQEKANEDFVRVTKRQADNATALLAELAGRDVDAGDLAGGVEWLTEALQLTPDDAVLLARRGELNGRLGRWQASVADLTRVTELAPDDHWSAYKLGPALVQIGEVDAYRRYCPKLLDRFEESKDVAIAERSGKACLLLPDVDHAILKRAAKLADLGIENGRNSRSYPWYQLTKGMAEYRLGDFQQAAEWLQKPAGNPRAARFCRPAAYFYLAMAQHRLGQTAEALRSFESAGQIVDQDLPTLESGDLTASWHDWLFADIARREAEKLIIVAESKQDTSGRD